MPRPIEALIHVDALAHNLARVRRVRAACPGLGGGQGQCLRSRHRAGLSGPARRGRLCAARPGRGRAGPRARLARPDPAARGLLRAARSRTVLAAGPVARGPRRSAARLAGRAQDAAPAPCLSEDEQRHEPARLQAGGLPCRLAPPVGPDPGRRGHADDALRRCRRAGRHRRPGRASSLPRPTTCRATARCTTARPACASASSRRPTGCAPASCCTGRRRIIRCTAAPTGTCSRR